MGKNNVRRSNMMTARICGPTLPRQCASSVVYAAAPILAAIAEAAPDAGDDEEDEGPDVFAIVQANWPPGFWRKAGWIFTRSLAVSSLQRRVEAEVLQRVDWKLRRRLVRDLPKSALRKSRKMSTYAASCKMLRTSAWSCSIGYTSRFAASLVEELCTYAWRRWRCQRIETSVSVRLRKMVVRERPRETRGRRGLRAHTTTDYPLR